MTTTLQKARDEKDGLVALLEANEAFKDVVNGVGITRQGDNYQLKVNLTKAVPEDKKIPDYNGVNIVYEVVGTIRALDASPPGYRG